MPKVSDGKFMACSACIKVGRCSKDCSKRGCSKARNRKSNQKKFLSVTEAGDSRWRNIYPKIMNFRHLYELLSAQWMKYLA